MVQLFNFSYWTRTFQVPEVLSPPDGDWDFFLFVSVPYPNTDLLVQLVRGGQTIRESGRKNFIIDRGMLVVGVKGEVTDRDTH